ncbi:MAG: PQQ-binding-like beta-propeller repeat protein [Euryarchaeota archaeon]|nr:PQQ-binding-like beta-propeller repeat protein [Euryarchaeota archaeon]
METRTRAGVVTLGIISLIVLSTLTLALAAPETDGSANHVTYGYGEDVGQDAEDWSQYRADAGHSGYTVSQLPSDLSMVWKYEGAAPDPAWTGVHTRMDFDYACEPVISGATLYFGSSSDCKVYALDTLTGEERWTFFTGAPVRLAPAAWENQVFVTSDDGCLYCLSADTGGLLWKKDPPADSYKLGNDRMVSNWPARGGVAIKDDILYYGVGIWPTDEIYIYALDPADGSVIWVNDTCGNMFIGQPHTNSLAYSGISAQGYMTVAGDHLYVPTGRAVPAAFDIHTGELDYFFLEKYRELGGSRLFAAANDDYDFFFATSGNTRYHDENIGKRHAIFDGESGLLFTTCEIDSQGLVFSTERDSMFYIDSTDRELKAHSLSNLLHEPSSEEGVFISPPIRTVKTPEPADTISMIMAGDTIIAGTENNKVMIMSGSENRDIRTLDVDGVPYGLAVASGNLYVSTDKGTIYCFGASTGDVTIVQSKPAVVDPYDADEAVVNAAKMIIEESGVTEGYCLDAGCGDGALAYELAKRTDLHIIAIDPDPAMVALAQEKLDAAGIYGARVTVHCCNVSSADRYPNYFANLIVSGRSVTGGANATATGDVYHCLRPSGGVMAIGTPDSMEVTVRPELEGAGDWTHLYADAGSTACSDDQLVKGELGMLWWNDPGLDMPSRHGRGVGPLCKDGIMVSQGVDEIRAYDAYNGREIWRFSLEDIGKPYNQDNFCVGACITHGNMAIDGDTLYIRAGKVPTSYFRYTLALDLYTGNLLREYQVPKFPEADFDKCYVDEGYEAGCGMKDYGWGPFDWDYLPDYAYRPGSKWGYFSVDHGTIVGGIADTDYLVEGGSSDTHHLYTESKALFAMDADTGELKWMHRPEHSIRHNAIAIGAGAIYFVDRPTAREDRLGHWGEEHHPVGKLIALDSETGETIWDKPKPEGWGTLMVLSAQRDALLVTYNSIRGYMPSEIGGRIALYRASDGKLQWDKAVSVGYGINVSEDGVERPLAGDRMNSKGNQNYPYGSRPIILADRDMVFFEPYMFNLTTGEQLDIEFDRAYNCGAVAAGADMLVYRSATLGYVDMDNWQGRTKNWGGFRPACWLNTIPASGLVLIPQGIEDCDCSYLMQASVALEPR